MRVRTRLTVGIVGLVAGSMALVGYGVILVSQRFTDRDAAMRMRVIENSMQKAAEDALIQRDDLLLISYANFLRAQYPSFVQARIDWSAGGRTRELQVGERPPRDELETRMLSVSDPSDGSRSVRVALTIDKTVLYDVLGHDKRRLMKIILLVSATTLVASLALAFWLASSLTKPIHRLNRLAAEIASGKLGARMDYEGADEIGGLVRSFNAMSQRLEELDEIKKNFVSSVTHELRSPLGAIESFLTLVDSKIAAAVPAQDSAQVKDYLARIQTNVQRLSRFINDLLDVAKIEKGKMECVLKPVTVEPIAEEVCEFFGPKAQQQGIQLSSRLKELPPVMADPERLRQVLVNLVSNALKFTENGGTVAITGEQFREGAQRWVEITVEDTGRGMEPRDLDRLFQAFSQGHNSSQRVMGTKGTGLGLYISKSIVEQHGGKIGVKSAPGRGTAFSFSLQTAA